MMEIACDTQTGIERLVYYCARVLANPLYPCKDLLYCCLL